MKKYTKILQKKQNLMPKKIEKTLKQKKKERENREKEAQEKKKTEKPVREN